MAYLARKGRFPKRSDHGIATESFQGSGSYKMRGRIRHGNDHFGFGLSEEADEIGSLIGRDTAGHSQKNPQAPQ
jgi:hypothetical protein